jgi:hypothetical protein
LLVGIFENLELLRVGVIAGVDPDLLDPLRRFHRRFRFEMNVSHDRHLTAAFAQSAHNVLQVRRVFYGRCGNAHNLATHRRQFHRLRDRSFRVHRIAGYH